MRVDSLALNQASYCDMDIVSRFKYESVLDDAENNFQNYEEWANDNIELIKEHIVRYIGKIGLLGSYTNTDKQHKEEARYFGIINLGEVIGDKKENEIVSLINKSKFAMDQTSVEKSFRGANGDMGFFKETIKKSYPEIGDSEQLDWLEQKLNFLYSILPEFVIKEGGMGKAIKTIMGVMAIASVDSMGHTKDERRNRLEKAIRPAYYFGATYPLVDDILLDSDYVGGEDKNKYHESIVNCLRNGESIGPSDLPDHPLSDEMRSVYDGILQEFPFADNREIYEALEAMYLSQYNDAHIKPQEIKGTLDIYPMVSVKASMSRIVANLFAGRKMNNQSSNRLLGTILRNQFYDDMRDCQDDMAINQHTPYTLAIKHPDTPIGNPLEKTLSYEAYVANVIYGDKSEEVAESLARSGASYFASMMCGDTEAARMMQENFCYGEYGKLIKNVIEASKSLPSSFNQKQSLRIDQKVQKYISDQTINRDPQIVNPQTYISDAAKEINRLLKDEFAPDKPIQEVSRYIIEAGGKRVRPGLTLMLAESLGIDRSRLDPLLIYTELIHASSLIFDDLPAQDNATVRRGRPTAHIKFAEHDAQLAGVSMVAHAIGVLGRLNIDFPAEKVNKVVEYVGVELGSKLCLGQHMDLTKRSDMNLKQLLETYDMKTSATIEGSLMPLMILCDRPVNEMNAIKDYAYNAGLVFQIQDDILNKTSSIETMGKDSGTDIGNQNVVNLIGLDESKKLLEKHRIAAIEACKSVEFPTGLLQNLVNYFGTRKK
jgi:geranylgeranyl pyrophosphate synthase